MHNLIYFVLSSLFILKRLSTLFLALLYNKDKPKIKCEACFYSAAIQRNGDSLGAYITCEETEMT
jgi:hypothetical protein